MKRIEKKYIVPVIMAGFIAMFGISCGDDLPPPANVAKSKPADAAKVADKKPVAPPPVIAPVETKKQADYIYTSVGKRDPFRSPFEDLEAEELIEGESDRIIGPLQNYDLASFVVTGIIWGTTSPTAMVIAPDGSSYVVKVGTLIGRNWGKVTKIKQDRIVVQEVVRKDQGQKITQTTELKLPLKRIKNNIGEGTIGTDEGFLDDN